MKKLLLLFGMILAILPLSGQGGLVPYSPVFMTYSVSDLFVNYQYHVREVLDKDNSISGSPYVFDKFQSGIVYSKKEKAAFNLELNINAFTNHFEFLYKDEFYEMPNFAFDSVVINSTIFMPVSIVEDDKVNIYSMEVIDSDSKGNFLLKRNIVMFSDKKLAGPYNDAQPPLFRKSDPIYYFNNSTNRLISLSNLRSLSQEEGMPEDLNAFIKKNRIKKNSEAGLVRLFSFVYGSN